MPLRNLKKMMMEEFPHVATWDNRKLLEVVIEIVEYNTDRIEKLEKRIEEINKALAELVQGETRKAPKK